MDEAAEYGVFIDQTQVDARVYIYAYIDEEKEGTEEEEDVIIYHSVKVYFG